MKLWSFLDSKFGHLDEAESLFRRAIRLDPEFADSHTNLASLLENKGQLIEAEQLYLNALTLDPKNGDYCNNYGAFLTNTGSKINMNCLGCPCHSAFDKGPARIETSGPQFFGYLHFGHFSQ